MKVALYNLLQVCAMKSQVGSYHDSEILSIIPNWLTQPPFPLFTEFPQCPFILSVIEMIIIASHEFQFSFSVWTIMIVRVAL